MILVELDAPDGASAFEAMTRVAQLARHEAGPRGVVVGAAQAFAVEGMTCDEFLAAMRSLRGEL